MHALRRPSARMPPRKPSNDIFCFPGISEPLGRSWRMHVGRGVCAGVARGALFEKTIAQ